MQDISFCDNVNKGTAIELVEIFACLDLGTFTIVDMKLTFKCQAFIYYLVVVGHTLFINTQQLVKTKIPIMDWRYFR